MFSYQTVGVRPSYIDATWHLASLCILLLWGCAKESGASRMGRSVHRLTEDISTQKKSRPKADAGAQKVKWDQAFVKKLC